MPPKFKDGAVAATSALASTTSPSSSKAPVKQDNPPPSTPLSTGSQVDGPVILYWHRTDLRLHDSPALHSALSLKPRIFIPVWTWDPHYVYRARVGVNRWQFLLESQTALSEGYRSLNPRQKLWVVRSPPQRILPVLLKKWEVSHLVFETDTDAYARERDEEVIQMAKGMGVEVMTRTGRTLWDSDQLVESNGGKPTMSLGQTVKAISKTQSARGGPEEPEPDRPAPTPESVPDPWNEDKMNGLRQVDDVEKPESTPDFNAAYRREDDEQYHSLAGPNGDFGVPTLQEMGFDVRQATTPHHGGEPIALRMLADYIRDEAYIATFEKPKTSPAAFEPQSTTLLSPHLHFGTLGIRKYWWDVQGVIERRKRDRKPHSEIPVSLPGQLLFREMYFGAQAKLGWRYAQTRGNKVARWIDWDLPSNYIGKSLPNGADGQELEVLDGTYTVDSARAEEWFRRWKEGRTGFPWIDALMRQLKLEGWIHHLGRHAVACFLTRGGCYVHWERGAEVFEEWLVDHETASNVGNWMWLSCTAFFSQFYRVYSPVAFPKKWDPEAKFVRKYVPELAGYDKKYIYEPWKASLKDQRDWGCRVTGNGDTDGEGLREGEPEGVKTYPKPMFDFDERRKVCIAGMKKAYELGMYGDDPRVLDGSWKKVFGRDDEEVKDTEVADETNGVVGGLVGTGEKKRKRRGEEQREELGTNRNEVDGEVESLVQGEGSEGQAGEAGEARAGQQKEDTENTRRSGRVKAAGGNNGINGGGDVGSKRKGKQKTLDAMVVRKKMRGK